MGDQLRRNPVSVVRHLYRDKFFPVPRLDPGADKDVSARTDRIQGIEQQIDHHLFDFGLVRRNNGQGRRRIDPARRLNLSEFHIQQARAEMHHLIDIHLSRGQGNRFGKIQQLLENGFQALALGFGDLEPFFVITGEPVVLPQDLEVHFDGGQWIADFMGQRRRDLPDVGHALHLPVFFLQLHPAGDIPDNAKHMIPALEPGQPASHFRGQCTAVHVQAPVFECAGCGRIGHRTLQNKAADLWAVFLMNKVQKRSRQDIFRGIDPVHPAEGRVHERNGVPVQHQVSVTDLFHQGFVLVLGFP